MVLILLETFALADSSVCAWWANFSDCVAAGGRWQQESSGQLLRRIDVQSSAPRLCLDLHVSRLLSPTVRETGSCGMTGKPPTFKASDAALYRYKMLGDEPIVAEVFC